MRLNKSSPSPTKSPLSLLEGVVEIQSQITKLPWAFSKIKRTEPWARADLGLASNRGSSCNHEDGYAHSSWRDMGLSAGKEIEGGNVSPFRTIYTHHWSHERATRRADIISSREEGKGPPLHLYPLPHSSSLPALEAQGINSCMFSVLRSPWVLKSSSHLMKRSGMSPFKVLSLRWRLISIKAKYLGDQTWVTTSEK